MKKPYLIFVGVCLFLGLAIVSFFILSNRSSSGAHYQTELLPFKAWTFGYSQTQIVVDGTYGKNWSAPCGWTIDLGFFQITKYDDINHVFLTHRVKH
jgi:hypothetical protein